MITNWKYTDGTNNIVTRTLASGGLESCFVSEIADWIAAGNTPDPADGPTSAQLWAEHQEKAREALKRSDITIWRCAENGVSVPTEWAVYRKSLRAIIAASSGDPIQPIPAQPPFPPGT